MDALVLNKKTCLSEINILLAYGDPLDAASGVHLAIGLNEVYLNPQGIGWRLFICMMSSKPDKERRLRRSFWFVSL